MSKSKDQLRADAEKLRNEIARNEAIIGNQKSKLAKIEALLNGEPAPESGLDLLWRAALPIARTRSSKQKCRVSWNRIPKHARPTIQEATNALLAWNRCEEWRKDGNAYVPGLHRWIDARQWENLPEGSAERDVAARYRTTSRPLPETKPEDAVTDRDEIAVLLSIRPKRVNS